MVDGKDILIETRKTAIGSVPKAVKGSQPTDGGNFLFTEKEKIDFLATEPKAQKFIKPFISAHEFLHNQKRYCLWLIEAMPNEINQMPTVLKRVEGVRQMRLKSSKAATVN